MVIQMIKVSIGKSCQSWGQCVFDAPDVFSLEKGERKTWSYLVDDSFEDQLLVAQSHCPNNAISLKKVDDE